MGCGVPAGEPLPDRSHSVRMAFIVGTVGPEHDRHRLPQRPPPGGAHVEGGDQKNAISDLDE